MQQAYDETSDSLSFTDDGKNLSMTNFRTIDSAMLNGSTYKGEGNATFVVSLPCALSKQNGKDGERRNDAKEITIPHIRWMDYLRTCSTACHEERKVLRFHKSDPERGDEPAEDNGKARVQLAVEFHKNFISELMGSYSSEPEIVWINSNELFRWISKFEEIRPEHRRHKKVVETFATSLPDYTLLPGYLDDKLPSNEERPTFCVEIKPKQGFVNKEISMLRGKCDYCWKQYSKMAKGKISTVSDYCPCDLFSGQAERMHRAVRGLVNSPQNNFRIFKNGELVYGEDFNTGELDNVLAEWFHDGKSFDKEKSLDTLMKLMCEALLRPFPRDESYCSSNNSSTVSLSFNSVLERILHMQRLNTHSIDFVHRIYSAYSNILKDEIIYSTKKSTEDISNSVLTEKELLVLRNYLLHRIGKDCSIMIAFREINSSSVSCVPIENVIKISNSRFFLFKNAVTDLEPKSVHSIEKHYCQRRVEDS